MYRPNRGLTRTSIPGRRRKDRDSASMAERPIVSPTRTSAGISPQRPAAGLAALPARLRRSECSPIRFMTRTIFTDVCNFRSQPRLTCPRRPAHGQHRHELCSLAFQKPQLRSVPDCAGVRRWRLSSSLAAVRSGSIAGPPQRDDAEPRTFRRRSIAAPYVKQEAIGAQRRRRLGCSQAPARASGWGPFQTLRDMRGSKLQAEAQLPAPIAGN